MDETLEESAQSQHLLNNETKNEIKKRIVHEKIATLKLLRWIISPGILLFKSPSTLTRRYFDDRFATRNATANADSKKNEPFMEKIYGNFLFCCIFQVSYFLKKMYWWSKADISVFLYLLFRMFDLLYSDFVFIVFQLQML